MVRMLFGKHKGEEVSELPDDYLLWLHDTAEISNERLRQAILDEYWVRFGGAFDGLSEETSKRLRELVDAGFKSLSLKYHPDLGGSNDAMRETLEARSWLLKRIVEGRPTYSH